MAGERQSQSPQDPSEPLPSLREGVFALLQELKAVFNKMLYRARNLRRTNIELGIKMLEAGKALDALVRFRVACWIDGGYPPAWYYLGLAQLDSGKPDKAEAAFRKALMLDPRFNDAIYMLTMMLGKAPGGALPSATPYQVMRRQFDSMAATYDDVQIGEYDYNGHVVVQDAYREYLRSDGNGKDVLDIGCGTGLCGEALQPYVASLTGVDLSPAMLAQAKARRSEDDRRLVYDHLFLADARSYLQHHAPERFDVVVAANLFGYYGIISPFLDGACRVLRPGGHVILTAESGPQDGYAFDRERALFAHSESSLRQQAEASGLQVVDLSMAEVYEREPGWCMVCRKPS